MRTALAFVTIGLCATMTWAEPVTVAGVVVDGNGQPVAGARVWVVRPEYDVEARTMKPVLEAEGRSDAEGRFSFEGVDWPEPHTGYRPPAALAMAQGYALGWDAPDRTGEQLRVVLQAPQAVACSVRDADGEAVGDATARVYYLGRMSADRPGRYDEWVYLPEDGAPFGDYRADENGRFLVDLAPPGAAVGLDVEVPGYRTLRCYVQEGELALRLGAPGTLAGRLTCEDAGAVAGRRLRISGASGSVAQGSSGYRLTETVETDEQGRFTLDQLPPGEYEVSVLNEPDDEWQYEQVAEVALKAEERREDVELALQRAWPVTGRVTVVETGEPIAGLTVGIHNAGRVEGPATSVRTQTDEDGRYRMFFLPGKASVSVYTGEDYVRPTPYYTAVDVVAGEGAVMDAELHRALQITGVVVDEDGAPVARAEVRPHDLTRSRSGRNPLSDAEGRFVWPSLRPGEELALSAVTDTAVTARPVTATAGQEGVRLVVSEKFAAGVRGRVIDDVGQSVGGATVDVIRRIALEDEVGRVSFRMEWRLQGDEEGRFEQRALFGGEEYSLQVSVPGFVGVETEGWTSARGVVHEVGDVVLIGGRARLAGVVVDEGGEAVVGARVFNRGDGPALSETTTDAAGRFELGGLFEGTAYAFAEAEGYRFSGASAPTGSEDVRIVMPPADGPRPERPCRPPTLDPERRRELIGQVVREGMEPARGDERTMRALVGSLARVDPVLGQELWQQEALGDEAELAKYLPFGLAASDPEAALDWAWKVENNRLRAHYLLELARRLVATDPDTAEQAFSLAASAARGEEAARAAVYLARTAMAMMQADVSGWQSVAEEAGELAATLGTEEWVDGDARSEAAMALAPVDLAAARALIDGLSGHAESYASMAQHGMVILIAGVDPEQAEALIEEWKLQGGDGQLAAVAWAMAAVDLERALAFARGIRDQGERGYALACVGLRLADDDRARAFDLVDEGMGEAAAETSRIAYDLGRTGEMGTMVAWAGLEAGHPDMQGLVLRAMSLRPDAGQATRGRTPDGSPAPDNRLEMRAKALAFVDVPAARQVIESLLMGLPAVATGRSGYHYVHMWVGPAAVADPEWTLEFARGLPDDEPGGEAKLKLWVYRRLADVLAMTDEEQLDDVLDYWAPGTPAM